MLGGLLRGRVGFGNQRISKGLGRSEVGLGMARKKGWSLGIGSLKWRSVVSRRQIYSVESMGISKHGAWVCGAENQHM